MPRQDRFPKVRILDAEIDIVKRADAIAFIIENANTPPARYISKPYVEFFDDRLNNAGDTRESRENLRQLLDEAFMCLPEGVAMQWAAYYQANEGGIGRLVKTLLEIVFAPSKISSVIPEKFGGTNFTWPLLEEAAHNNLKVYLVGSPAAGTIESTAEYLRANIAGLNITGTFPGRDSDTGTFSESLESRLVEDLRHKKPDIVLVGIGFPQQEFLIRRLTNRLEHGIFIGEGGTFDYRSFGGKFRKAPKLLQLAGLEWFWRLILQPKRIKRQLAIPKFIAKIYRDHPRRRNR